MKKCIGMLFICYGMVIQGTGFSGENIWRLTNTLCSVVEANDSEIDASLSAVYSLATDIDAHLDNLTGSSLSIVASSLEQFANELMMANSITDNLASNIDIFSMQLESLVDAITILDNLETLVVGGTCSCLDLAIQSAINVVGSTIDATKSDLDSCCSTLSVLDTIIRSDVDSVLTKVDSVSSNLGVCCSTISMMDTIIKSDVDSVSTKVDSVSSNLGVCCSTISMLDTIIKSDVDSVSTKVDSVSSNLGVCCSTISMLDTIIKSDVDSVSTKIDGVSSQISVVKSELDSCCSVVSSMYHCLVGTGITQSMVPYTITTPGTYYLCQSVSASGAPTITISTSNVYLNLNGNTLANTNNRGVQSIGNSNIDIVNGTIRSSLEGVYVTTGSDISLVDLTINFAASTSIYIDTVVEATIKNCSANFTNGQLVTNNAAIVLFNTGPGWLINTTVSNQTETGAIGFYIWRGTNNSTIELINCVADIATYGFYVNQDLNTNTNSNVIFRDCVATNNITYGFYALSTSNAVQGPLYENCAARANGPTTSGIGFVNDKFLNTIYENCVADLNNTGFLALESTNVVYKSCIANNNIAYGFHLGTVAGVGNTHPMLNSCLATNNGTNGFFIESLNSLTELTRCIAGRNTSSGINNASANTFIVDSRSQHGSTLDNPLGYNLNGAVDVIGGATQIIIS